MTSPDVPAAPSRPLPARSPGQIVERVALGAAFIVGVLISGGDPFSLFFFATYAIAGSLLVLRRPGNVIGRLLVAIGLGFSSVTTTPALDVAALQAGTSSWAEFLVAWVQAWGGYLLFGGFLALTLLFPSGRWPERPWRRPAQGLLGLCVAMAVLVAVAPQLGINPTGGAETVLIPNRLAVLPDLPVWELVPLDSMIVVILALLAVGLASMLIRYRRTTGIARLQLRWLVAALAFVILAVVVGLASYAVIGDIGGQAWIPAIIAYPTVPTAVLVAVLRYRLYEIDRIISRTIGWTLVTGISVVVFATAVLGLQAVLAGVTQGATLAVAASTLVAFALFQPLRRRVQRAVDRRFDRARYDGERVVAAFGEQLRDRVDLATVESDIAATVREALRPGAVAVWVRREADG